MTEAGASKFPTVTPMDRKSSVATSLSRRSASPVRLQAGCSAMGSKAGSSSLYVLQEFYDELRGIEAEPVGNETVVSCHRDARFPADMADLSWIEAEPVGDETVVSC